MMREGTWPAPSLISYHSRCPCRTQLTRDYIIAVLRSSAMDPESPPPPPPPPPPSRQERRAVARTVARAVKKKRRIGKHQLLCPPLADERRH